MDVDTGAVGLSPVRSWAKIRVSGKQERTKLPLNRGATMDDPLAPFALQINSMLLSFSALPISMCLWVSQNSGVLLSTIHDLGKDARLRCTIFKERDFRSAANSFVDSQRFDCWKLPPLYRVWQTSGSMARSSAPSTPYDQHFSSSSPHGNTKSGTTASTSEIHESWTGCMSA